ncbi:MAG: polysaccharide deacetylase family protein [Desulfobacterales bacterium]
MRESRAKLSLAEKTGMSAGIGALLFSCADPLLAAVPLVLFVMLCACAPFLPGFSFFLPVITRGISGKKAVSLTFDDGPDPLSTPALLRVLSRHRCRATFFVCGKKAEAYPELIREIIEMGHSVGNHTYSHDNLIMLRSIRSLRHEIEKTSHILNGFGIRAHAFRPPVGITNPRLREVLGENKLYAVNFSCRAPDGGNRWIKGMAARILGKIRADDILLLHDIPPKPEENLSQWLGETDRLLQGIKEKGFSVLPLSELIQKPVMEICEEKAECP